MLVPPHGGRGLRALQVEGQRVAEETRRAQTLPQLPITSREKGDLVMLGIGGFTPLEGFLAHDDWKGVCDEMRTPAGLFWPIPVTLSTEDESVKPGGEVALTAPDAGRRLGGLQGTAEHRREQP